MASKVKIEMGDGTCRSAKVKARETEAEVLARLIAKFAKHKGVIRSYNGTGEIA